jgi:hypothetical protein
MLMLRTALGKGVNVGFVLWGLSYGMELLWEFSVRTDLVNGVIVGIVM